MKKRLENKLKEGLDFVFNQTKELVKVGTKEEYAKYINTIFPRSKVKGIVHRGDDRKNARNFNGCRGKIRNQTRNKNFPETFGTYFANELKVAKAYSKNIYSAVIDIKNLYNAKKEERYKFQNIDIDLLINLKNKIDGKESFVPGVFVDEEGNLVGEVDIQSYDGVHLPPNHQYNYEAYVVFEPEQIHILGSEKDMKMFSNWKKAE